MPKPPAVPQSVSIEGIIQSTESLRLDVIADEKMTLEQKIKLHNSLVDRQMKAAFLDLQYRRSAARLPESGLGLTAMLTGKANSVAKDGDVPAH